MSLDDVISPPFVGQSLTETELREMLAHRQRLILVGREHAEKGRAYAEHHMQVANLIAAELKRRGLNP